MVETDEYKQKWVFNLLDLYKLALNFYKEKSGKAVHLSYGDKLKLVAFTKQVTYGKFTHEANLDVGYLDLIGNDRRQDWLALGDMSKEVAMAAFINLLDNVCPLFKPFVEAHKTDIEEKEQIRIEEEGKKLKEEEEKRLEEQKLHLTQEQQKQEAQHQTLANDPLKRRQIQEALNQQTYHQFRAYAEEQYPGNPEQQQVLIHQLQEQCYQQYIQQVYQQQLIHQWEQAQQLQAMAAEQRSQDGDEKESSDEDASDDTQ